jgi:hypothetical protein
MDDQFVLSILTGWDGVSNDDGAEAVASRRQIEIPPAKDRNRIVLSFAHGYWAERWPAGPGGRRVRVILPEHGKSGAGHMGKEGWLLEQDRSNGRSAVQFDGKSSPTVIEGCCLQDMESQL